MREIAIAALISIAWMADASAFCSEPSFYETPPDAPGSFSRPSMPLCLSGYRFSGTHSCSEWEINRYIDEINDYIEELNDFVREANSFAEAALSFNDEAYEYARCESDDVKSELE